MRITKRNTQQSTKIAQQAGPVDVGVKIASYQMKCARINRKCKLKEHVKERDVDNKRNTCHSTKTALRVTDANGAIEATKKKRDKLRGGRVEVDNDCCENCRRKNFSPDPRYALEFKDVSNTEIRANPLATVKPKNRHTQVTVYLLCQECVRFLKKQDIYTGCRNSASLDARYAVLT